MNCACHSIVGVWVFFFSFSIYFIRFRFSPWVTPRFEWFYVWCVCTEGKKKKQTEKIKKFCSKRPFSFANWKMKPIESALESKVIFFSAVIDTLLPSSYIHNQSLEIQLKLIVEQKLIYQIKSGHKPAHKNVQRTNEWNKKKNIRNEF